MVDTETAADTDMGSARYSLRWNNHQNHLLNAFECLLQNETLVDVTLVCEETTFKAHKVVLSACSPYFQKIFCETPCKHPVIVLKDLQGWEMQAIVDFMYKGEISVGHEQLSSLINAAESLQVRGLAHTEQIPMCDGGDDPTRKSAESITSGSNLSSCSQAPPMTSTPCFPPSPATSGSGIGRPNSGADNNNNNSDSLVDNGNMMMMMMMENDRRSNSDNRNNDDNMANNDNIRNKNNNNRRINRGDKNSSNENRNTRTDDHINRFLPPMVSEPPAAHSLNLNPVDAMLMPNFPPHLTLPRLPFIPSISFADTSPPFPHTNSVIPRPPRAQRRYQSSLPRRKQARPRRRTGEMNKPQDLSKHSRAPSLIETETAENLSLKKNSSNCEQSCSGSRNGSPIRPHSGMHCSSPGAVSNSALQMNCNQLMKTESEESELCDITQSQPMELTTNSSLDPHQPDFHFNNLPPDHPLSLLPHHRSGQNSPSEHSPGHLPPLSSLSLTPPHMFPLDTHLGLFPGLDSCRSFLLNDILDPKLDPPPLPSGKKKMCRPKGQHSAPRGGPPRSWTNAELTEALQHVWNKKMTTSQASRIFGIPYNSLLMYVRGKYGKSLKLEKLKQECFGDTLGPLDLLTFNSHHHHHSSNNNSGNKNKNHNSHHHHHHHHHDSNKSLKLHEPPDLMLGPPGFHASPFPSPNFYHDFGPSFPVPIGGMMHLLPPPPPPQPPTLDDNDDIVEHQRSNSAPIDYDKTGSDDNSPLLPLDFAKEELPFSHPPPPAFPHHLHHRPHHLNHHHHNHHHSLPQRSPPTPVKLEEECVGPISLVNSPSEHQQLNNLQPQLEQQQNGDILGTTVQD